MEKIDCPFGSLGCPHVQSIKEEQRNTDRKLDMIQKTLYVIVGIIAVEFGILII